MTTTEAAGSLERQRTLPPPGRRLRLRQRLRPPPPPHQWHKEKAQVPAGSNSRLCGDMRIVAYGMATADRELCRPVGGLLVVLALEADQFCRDRSAVNGIEDLQLGSV